ncbi:MAG: hypothetical protein K0S41_957 [Anaerocolumna sp.]|jgi:hypothetical protein|nr:hypothetical protein [Anaerocolumna sp.]
MKNVNWEISEETESLRQEISEYVEKIVDEKIPCIPFAGYRYHRDTGSRKEFEESYFQVRKQLTAVGLYLQWKINDKVVEYFNELLWSICNEFSWCLAAHLSYGNDYFNGKPEKNIDLFAAETAETLSELSIIHADKIDSYILTHIRNQVKNRVLTPFIEQNWGYETSLNNWCAVCSGSIGIAALLLEDGERKKIILDKVERALTYYLKCFGEDGATEEGIGYWAYGFGYYNYYIAMRKEYDPDYTLSPDTLRKMKSIAEFPAIAQITETNFIPFSDVSAGTLIPTGLISYLYQEYGVTPPASTKITPFDFEHCYRFAHISRNLWWTSKDIFQQQLISTTNYFPHTQWLVQKNHKVFFAMKGGHNKEEHNHNDVGNFVLALNGELFLTDLGAGPYTAEYFGEKRYQYPHTRSYWHNVPYIDNGEQIDTATPCHIEEIITENNKAGMYMELSALYQNPKLLSLHRKIFNNLGNSTVTLTDQFKATKEIEFEEGFISAVKPIIKDNGIVEWIGNNGALQLTYDSNMLKIVVEENEIPDHSSSMHLYYRVGLKIKNKSYSNIIKMTFSYNLT